MSGLPLVSPPRLLWRLHKKRLAVQASAHVVQGANVELRLERVKGIEVIEVFRSVAELEIAADRKRHNLEL